MHTTSVGQPPAAGGVLSEHLEPDPHASNLCRETTLSSRQSPTFDVKLGVDDVAHDGGEVQVLDCLLGAPGAGEEHPGQAQVLASAGVKQDLHLFHLAILATHVLQEGFPHVVIQPCESHFLQGDLSDVEFIQLWGKQQGSRIWTLATAALPSGKRQQQDAQVREAEECVKGHDR